MRIRRYFASLCAAINYQPGQMTHTIQLLGISNAIVDVLAHVDKDFLDSVGAPIGSMTLIDEHQAQDIYAKMGPATEMSGGSVANTIAGVANLGGNTAYIGKVRNDQLGEIFNHDMRSLGVDIRLEPATDGPPTARGRSPRLAHNPYSTEHGGPRQDLTGCGRALG